MKIHEITVLPDTPPALHKLQLLTYNLYYSWKEDIRHLYRQMDEQLWIDCARNPIRFLSEVSTETLAQFAANPEYVAAVDEVYAEFEEYMTNTNTLYRKKYGEFSKESIAYFCCEFGLHESIPIYSGGLGILSGDHIKTASDMGIPMVGVGLLYRSGYFRQLVDQEGIQSETFETRNMYSLPIQPVVDEQGETRYFSLDLPTGKLWYNAYELKVGRVSIYLLNTSVPQNSPERQRITDRLYVSDREERLLQEYLLGIGGFRVLSALGYPIEVYHLNEGHSAFLLLEYARQLMQTQGLSFEEAKLFIQDSSCFTTHTPVPAGNEHFSLNLIEKYFRPIADELGLSWEYFLSLGRKNTENKYEEFCLTILALKMCNHNNGVSRLHGEVSREMWHELYKPVVAQEVPITSITNAVHGETWTDIDLQKLLLSKNSGGKRRFDAKFYQLIREVSDEELSQWKKACKRKLIEYVRKHLYQRYQRCQAGQHFLNQAQNILDENALTIGFARRFATYKRGNLFLRDRERIGHMLQDNKHPIQFIIAGKAHPADQYGKDIIKSIHTFAREMHVEHKIVFLENYNTTIAKYLVTGVDVWLNTPVRPQEASGTSGMKAGLNGVLNLSVADGWWVEAYNQEIGWNIESHHEFTNEAHRDNTDADILYSLLENEVIPTYYEQNGPYSKEWLGMMRSAIEQIGGHFNSYRMLNEYMQTYDRVRTTGRSLAANDYTELKALSVWKQNLYKTWPSLRITDLSEISQTNIQRGESFEVRANVELGEVDPEHIEVQCYCGEPTGADTPFLQPIAISMELVEQQGAQSIYAATITPDKGGKFGYTIRIIPKHKRLSYPLGLGLLRWFE